MGSCCSYKTKSTQKFSKNEIIDIPGKKNLKQKIIVISPQEPRSVPKLKKLQNNPLYKRRRRKSLDEYKKSLSTTLTKIKRVSYDDSMGLNRKKIVTSIDLKMNLKQNQKIA